MTKCSHSGGFRPTFMKIPLYCLGFGLCLFPTVAPAQTVQTIPFAFVPNGFADLVFDKFDTLGGTRELLSVVISMELRKLGGFTAVDNDSETGGAISITHSVTGILDAVDSEVHLLDPTLTPIGGTEGLKAITTSSASVEGTTGDDTTTFNETLLSDYASFSPPETSVSATGIISPLFNSDYVAGSDSSFTLRFSGDQSANSEGVSGLQQVFTVSDVSGFVSVTYNFAAAVPEPSSSLLTGCAAVGLLTRRRR